MESPVMWNVYPLGDDEVRMRIDGIEITEDRNEFLGGPVHWYMTYAITRTIYLLFTPLIFAAIVIYIIQNDISYGSIEEFLSMVFIVTLVFLVSFPINYGMFYLRLLPNNFKGTGIRDSVRVGEKGILVNYTVTEGWITSKEIHTHIPFDSILNICPVKYETGFRIKYWFLKLITMSIWKPAGSLHNPFTPLNDIIMIELDRPLEMIRYGSRISRKYGPDTFTSDRTFIQIRKRDQNRFFELLGIDI